MSTADWTRGPLCKKKMQKGKNGARPEFKMAEK